MRRIYSFMGSKRRMLDIINDLIIKSNKKYFIEPFLGSGIVYLNLCKPFDSHWINDYQYELLLIFKNAPYILDKLNDVILLEKEYSIETSKEGYYKFRELMNNEKDEVIKSIMLFMVGNCCINNMLRFNGSKFNQGYGNGKYSNKLDTFKESINYILETKPKITNCNFIEVLNEIPKNSLVFLDPPYLSTSDSSYSKHWNTQNLKDLISFIIKRNDIDFIYTDIENDINKPLLNIFNYKNTVIKNISPNRKKETNHNEFICSNLIIQKDYYIF